MERETVTYGELQNGDRVWVSGVCFRVCNVRHFNDLRDGRPITRFEGEIVPGKSAYGDELIGTAYNHGTYGALQGVTISRETVPMDAQVSTDALAAELSSFDAFNLMPDDRLPQLPGLIEGGNAEDPTVWLKWFTPDSCWTWYVIGYDPDGRIAFGLVDGFEVELGDFSLDEIQEARGPRGLRIERDLHFKPRPLSEIRALVKRKRGGA